MLFRPGRPWIIPSMGQCIKVAVVDGNPATREVLSRKLTQVPGISLVGEAENQHDAMQIVRDRRPEVVVMDFRRFEPHGTEFVARLVGIAPEVGIVILTAFATDRQRSDLLRAGAKEILFKEIDSGALLRAIRNAVYRPSSAERGIQA